MSRGELMRRSIPAAALCLVFALCIGLVSAANAQPNPYQVGLVIQYKNGTIMQKCVQVAQAEVSGYEVLENANLTITADFGAYGAGICKIENDGCAADNCFCDMPNYWSYWHLDPGAEGGPTWRYSNLGASSYRVAAGAVEGWSYGAFGPPAVKPSFEEICLASAPTATKGENAPGATPTASAPTTSAFIPTSPPRWATAIIIGATATAPPPAAPPTQAPPPTAAEPPAQAPSATVGSAQSEVETPVEAPQSTEGEDLQTAAPSETPPAPQQPTQPPAPGQPTELAALAPQPTATQEASFQAAFEVPEPTRAAKPAASKLALALGGLAGLGAFAGFALLLLGALVTVILLRK